MRKVLPLSALALTALLFFTGGLVARDNRAQPVATNPDVICGPEVCAQLVPFRVGATPVKRPLEETGGS